MTPAPAVVVFQDSLAGSAALAAQYPSVGWVRIQEGTSAFRGTGVLISPEWVLTAGHNWLADKVTALEFHHAGSTYTAVPGQWYQHPAWAALPELGHTSGWDIGLFRLSQPVPGVTPASIHTGGGELGAVVTLIGAGRAGTHLTGPQNNPSAILYAVNNVIDRVIVTTTADHAPGGLLAFDFDNGSTTRNTLAGSAIYTTGGQIAPFNAALEITTQSSTAAPLWLEGTSAAGDSGGPAFADFGNGPELVGLVSWGVNPSNPANLYGSGLGDVTYLTRISAHSDWIFSVIPEPSMAILLWFGLLTALRRKR